MASRETAAHSKIPQDALKDADDSGLQSPERRSPRRHLRSASALDLDSGVRLPPAAEKAQGNKALKDEASMKMGLKAKDLKADRKRMGQAKAKKVSAKRSAKGEATVRARLTDPPAASVSPSARTRQRASLKPAPAASSSNKASAAAAEKEKPARKRKKKAPRRSSGTAVLDSAGNVLVVASASGRAAAGSVVKRDVHGKKDVHGKNAKRTSLVEMRHRPRAQRWQRTLAADLLGLGFCALAVLSGLALASYHPTDPGLSVSSAEGAGVENWIGPVGALLADGLTLLLGLIAFLMPLFLAAAGLAFLRARVRVPRLRQLLGLIVFALGGVLMLEVVLGAYEALPFPAGGLVGVVLGALLLPLLYPAGTGIVATVLIAMGTMVALDRSVAHALDQIASNLTQARKALFERAGVWREQRRLLQEEYDRLEDEILEQAEIDREEAEESQLLRRDRIALRAEEGARARVAIAVTPANEPAVEDEISGGGDKRADVDADKGVDASAQLPARPQIRSAPPVLVEVEEAFLARAPGDAEVAMPEHAEPDQNQQEMSAASLRKAGHDPAWVADVNPCHDVSKYPGARKQGLQGANEKGSLEESQRASLQDAAGSSTAALAKAGVDDGTTAKTKLRAKSKAKKGEAVGAAAEQDSAGLRIVERTDGEEVVLDADDPTIPDQAARAYERPPLRFLDYDAPDRMPVDEEKMFAEAEKLMRKFNDFGIDGCVREVRPGPVVTTYEFVPAPGIKVSRIAALSDDIAMAMEAVQVRIVAPIPGKGAVGIEIPNERRETVYLKEIIASERFKQQDGPLVMALGKDIEGKPYTADLAAMPHVLVSGTTGSGKSVSVNGMICSLLYRSSPEDVKFLMIDPKMLELSVYEGIPHLLLPPIIDSKKAANALAWAVQEMERRYKAMSELGVRDVQGFNDTLLAIKSGTDQHGRSLPKDDKGKPFQKLPYIVIVVDEYADLIAIAGKEVEGYIMRLAQKARAAGLHVMLATQRPSVDVITGVIKANFPVRMGFRLASSHDSKTIINRPGAEKLLGRGDMLIMPPGTSNVTRVHGAFISENELHRVVSFLKKQGEPNYDMSIVEPPRHDQDHVDAGDEDRDSKWDEAIRVVGQSGRCSTSWLQRQLAIGYNRAARIVEMMEREGIVGPQQNSKGDREIFISPSDG